MPPRSIAELIANMLDRAAIPVDEEGEQLFSEINPGYIADEVMRATVPTLDETLEEVTEIEQHFHNDELWWGATAAPNQDNAIDANVNRPFQVISGNNTWGAAVPVVGRLDNPVKPWQTSFDMHRIAVAAVSNATAWRIRFLYSDQSLEEAAQALRYTMTMNIATGIGANVDGRPADLRMRPIPVGWIVWAQGWNATGLATLDFFHGAHGYPVRSL